MFAFKVFFLFKNNFEDFLKKSLEKLEFKRNDCYPVELIKDFMYNRLPPFKSNSNQSDNSDISLCELGILFLV